MLASADLPPKIDHDVDMRTMTAWSAIYEAFEVMLETGNQAIRVIGPAPGGAQFIEVVIDEYPLRQAMYRFSRNVVLLSLVIAILTAALVYFALHYLFVRPMRRLTANLVGFHENPESSARIIVPSRRGDEIGVAEREIERYAARSRLHAASEKQACRARSRGVEDQSRSAQSAGVVAAAVGSTRQRARSARSTVCTEADALAGARHRLLSVDVIVWPCAGSAARSPYASGGAVVNEVRESAGLAADASLTWVNAIERGLMIDADPDHLFRILLNLVRNAAQALENQPQSESVPAQIRVTGRREGAVTIIEVSDTGPGVPDRARAHLFEAFQGSARPGGSGLGLAIADELVRAHGGDIHLVEGTIGATFRITMPDRPVELHSVRNERARA